MPDPQPSSYPPGCLSHAVGAVFMCAGVAAAVVAVGNGHHDLAGSLVIAAAICFAAIAISEALRQRR